ncbi:MAG TPA: hypothetical protein VKY26_04725 [Actinomycetota bacterium]|nr:hypothetical protein [Actinomycetota bacterium]
MITRPHTRKLGDRGFVTVEYLVGVALSLVVLVVIANFIVWEYGRGVVGSAVDEGARAGARVPAGTPVPVQLATCRQSADQELGDLLGGASGPMGSGVSISCSESGNQLLATAHAHFAAWFPAMPGWTFTAQATAVVEPGE